MVWYGRKGNLAYSNAAQLDKGGYDDVLWANFVIDSVAVPNVRLFDKLVLGKHPVAASLGAKTAIVDEEHQVGAFTITTLKLLKSGLILGRLGVAIEAKLDGHATGLECTVRRVVDGRGAVSALTYPIYVHVR
jgi:hypothetical protein